MNYKIEKRLEDLELWYDYIQDGCSNLLTIKVDCNIKDGLAYFTCPFCVSKYKKNGEPYKYCERVVHHHGAGNGLGTRSPHCCIQARAYYDLPPFEFELVEKKYTLKFE
tara:strand:+ start:346 stop:672 length:327 start_codon:yes stop_codon:yes gene_type:complete